MTPGLNTRVRRSFLEDLTARVGPLERFGHGRSLFREERGQQRFLIRYSRVFEDNSTLWGLTDKDLLELEEHPSFICLLWPKQREPLLLPITEFAPLFRSSSQDKNGMYMATLHSEKENNSLEFRISNPPRKIDVSACSGWGQLSVNN